MRFAVRMTLFTMLLLGLAGCYHMVAMPTVATAVVYGPALPIRSLTPPQVARLSRWLKAHDAGWRRPAAAPSSRMTLSMVLREPTGRQSRLDLFESKDGTAMVYFYAPAPALAFERYLSAADVLALLACIAS